MTLDTADERALWERAYLASPTACPALRADAAVEEYRERLPSAQACKVCGARERRECSECPARLPSGDAPPQDTRELSTWDMERGLAQALGYHGPTKWQTMLKDVQRLREASRPPGAPGLRELPPGWAADPDHGNRVVADGVEVTIFDGGVRVDADGSRTVPIEVIDWLLAKLAWGSRPPGGAEPGLRVTIVALADEIDLTGENELGISDDEMVDRLRALASEGAAPPSEPPATECSNPAKVIGPNQSDRSEPTCIQAPDDGLRKRLEALAVKFEAEVKVARKGGLKSASRAIADAARMLRAALEGGS